MPKRFSPEQASELLAQGWRYVDVRSVPEYEQGHPPGAYNIPLLHMVPGKGMQPNAEFGQVFQKHFKPGDQVILGCKVGPRSLRASELLAGMGYVDVPDLAGGFDEWKARLPVETQTPAGRGWEDLKK